MRRGILGVGVAITFAVMFPPSSDAAARRLFNYTVTAATADMRLDFQARRDEPVACESPGACRARGTVKLAVRRYGSGAGDLLLRGRRLRSALGGLEFKSKRVQEAQVFSGPGATEPCTDRSEQRGMDGVHLRARHGVITATPFHPSTAPFTNVCGGPLGSALQRAGAIPSARFRLSKMKRGRGRILVRRSKGFTTADYTGVVRVSLAIRFKQYTCPPKPASTCVGNHQSRIWTSPR